MWLCCLSVPVPCYATPCSFQHIPPSLGMFVMAPSGWWQRFSLACHCSSQYPSSPGFICCFAWGLGCACFAYGCAHTCFWAWGFLCFLAVLRPPSGSRSTGSSGYSSPLGFPTFAMGSPCYGSTVVVGTLPYFLPAGVCASVGGSALRPAAAGTFFPGGPHCCCLSWEVLGAFLCAPLTVGPLPGPPTLLCLLSAGCLLGWESSPSGGA